jgi:hypothetical protein
MGSVLLPVYLLRGFLNSAQLSRATWFSKQLVFYGLRSTAVTFVKNLHAIFIPELWRQAVNHSFTDLQIFQGRRGVGVGDLPFIIRFLLRRKMKRPESAMDSGPNSPTRQLPAALF